LSKYINNVTPIKIICKKCNNIFKQIPASHIYKKSGCFHCARKNNGLNLRKSKKQ
jgi:hypothetical protein